MTIIAKIWLIFAFISGCANQQPPGGGEEDKIPPKVSIYSPKPNSVNFKGRSIEFRFNEYVDKRSFQDAFRISPAIKGEIEFEWSGNDAEVVFPSELQKIEPNKTFVVNLSSSLKDIHGNAITEPVNFAFSTGPKIDKGNISGKVFNQDSNNIVSIFAYKINDTSGYDPTKNIPDYLTESGKGGSYVLTNLAPGKYRLIAVADDDRNLLFTSERENYGVLSYDITLADSSEIKNSNFYMKIIRTKETVPPELDYTKYFKDSLAIVYTSIENDNRIVSPEQSIFIFFNQHRPERESFVNSFKINGGDNQPEKLVFNWRNDSLVEFFAANKFKPNFNYVMAFDLPVGKDSVYKFSLKFKTVGKNSFGEIKGSVRTNFDTISFLEYPVKIELEANLTPVIKNSFEVRDTVFSLTNILEAEYKLFSYIDLNSDNSYNYGYPYPFEYAEPFYIYPQTLRIRGGWTVENVVTSFNK
ncbi:MAG TPA: Ig-like domain-containing protein [Ignavibacteria bacterium]